MSPPSGLVTKSEFDSMLKLAKTRIKGAKNLIREIVDPKTVPQDGQEYTLANANLMFTSALNSLDQLSKYYAYALKGKKRDPRPVNLNSGIRKPIQFNDNMLNFLKEANLGNIRTYQEVKVTNPKTGKPNKAYTATDTGAPLLSNLNTLLTQKTASPTALNALFNIHIARAGLVNPENGLLFRADALMTKYFSDTLARVQNDSRAELVRVNAQDGDRKPPLTKKGRMRKYYAQAVDENGNTIKGQLDTTRKIYNDHYHLITPDKIPRVSINSIIKYNRVGGPLLPLSAADKQLQDDLFLLTDSEQDAYREAINRAMLLNQPPNYPAYASEAINQLNLAPNSPGYNRLTLRGNTDTEESFARQTSKSYSLTK